MRTASEIEIEFGLPAGSVRINTDASGRSELTTSGSPVVVECSLWALRCVVRRKGFDAVIDAGIAALGLNQQTAAWAQWTFAGGKLSRSDVLVKQIAGWIGYNQRQMDTLFSSAVAVEALR